MQRGEVWWAQLPAPAGKRPVLLLTRDSVINSRSQVTVAAITQRARHIASEVSLTQADGLPKPCVVSADVIQTISKNDLLSKVTRLSRARLDDIAHAITFALALD